MALSVYCIACLCMVLACLPNHIAIMQDPYRCPRAQMSHAERLLALHVDYHLHIHVAHVQMDLGPGMAAGKAHLLDDVIGALTEAAQPAR